MSGNAIIYIFVGFLAMVIVSLARNKIYKLNKLKIILIMFLLTVFGVLGTMIMYFVETGSWGGTSFFGSIFLVPIAFYALKDVLKMKYGILMDYCAVPICMMLAVMKIRCLEAGCCAGRTLYVTADNKTINFPSQLVEMITILVIMVVLIRMEKQEKYKNEIYSWLFVLYGITRFVLNTFRAGLKPFVWILPNSHFWSLMAIALGWIVIGEVRRKKNRKR